jgi:hypothetical protein
VHVEEAFEPRLEGVQLTEVSVAVTAGIWSVMVAVGFWLPNVAVTIANAALEVVRVPVVAEKVAMLCPDNTVMLPGTVSAVSLLFRGTTVLDVAPWFRETVHVDKEFEPMLEGVQLIELGVAAPGTWSVTLAVRLWVPSVAVTIANGVLELVSAAVVAENVALLCPDNTVTLELTPSAALLLCSETIALARADSFRETVHVAEAPEPREDGVQATEVIATGGSRDRSTLCAEPPVPAVTMAD